MYMSPYGPESDTYLVEMCGFALHDSDLNFFFTFMLKISGKCGGRGRGCFLKKYKGDINDELTAEDNILRLSSSYLVLLLYLTATETSLWIARDEISFFSHMIVIFGSYHP